MSEHHVDAGKVDESEKVFDVELPSGDESSKAVHPGEEPFHLPAFSVAAELAPVLGLAPIAAVWCDQFDAVLVLEFAVEFVRIVGLVANQSSGKLVEKASGKNFLNKSALGRRSACDRYGERKTVASGDNDDLRILAPACGTDAEVPFFNAREGGIDERFFEVEVALFIEQSRSKRNIF